jgi:3-hydroxyisobutyrate dehydrogenase-like beta-hydroxyacid dehydrogenase
MAADGTSSVTISDKWSRRNGQAMNVSTNSQEHEYKLRAESLAGAPRRVGLIGLGLVGSAMAGRLIKAGFEVVGFDISGEAVARFAAMGGIGAGSVREVARSNDRILLSLPDGEFVRKVSDEMQPAIEPGTVVIDTTTAALDQVEATADRLKIAGASYLDATLSGSSEVIAAGQAAWLVGGSAKDFESAGPIFEAIGGPVHHLGAVGSGTKAKLISNLILGLNRAALAEGLALAEAWGMDMQATLAASKASAAYSKVMDAKGAKMIEGEYRPQARLKQHHKDVRLMLEAARSAGIDLPLSKLHDQLLTEAEAAGWGDADNAAIIEVWRGRRNRDGGTDEAS